MAEDVQGTPATPGGSGGASALSPGQRVGASRYTLLRQLGQGGMGQVWLARDEQLGEEVALKFLAREISHDADSLEELRRETLKSRRLTHPQIIRIHDLHQASGEAPFISMEYVDGQTLSALKAQQPSRLFAWDFLQPLVRQLCDALEYAHRHKVIHRDLKPANMMVNSDGELRLADFGIAAVASESMSRLSQQRNTSGTPAYMSPQQMDGRPPKVTDDIYALGATLYELLTSKPPFYHGNILHQVMNVPADPLDQRLADLELTNAIPPDVAALIMACLAKDPAQRPQSVGAVAEWIGLSLGPQPTGQLQASAAAVQPELEQGANEEVIVEAEEQEAAPAVRNGSKTGWWVGLTVTALALVALAGWWVTHKAGKSPLDSGDSAFLKEVATLPPEQQVTRVVAKLKELNPRFDGKAGHKIRNGQVSELSFSTDAVTNIAPVRALKSLEKLQCNSSSGRKTLFADLSPLRGLSLRSLICNFTKVNDLSPLRGMPLRSLNCMHTGVQTLSPLNGMPLEVLDIHTTQVSDLSPIRTAPLKQLTYDFKPDRNASIVRSIKTLEKINRLSAAEFWRKVEAGVVPLGCPGQEKAETAESQDTPAQSVDDTDWLNAINLLPLIDPQRDAIMGTWRRQGEDLATDGARYGRLELPYQPPAEYDFRIEFTPQGGTIRNEVIQLLTAEGRPFAWKMGAYGKPAVFCFHTVSPRAPVQVTVGENLASRRLTVTGLAGPLTLPVAVEASLNHGQRYTSLVEVRRDSFAAFVDGKLILRCQTDYQQVSLESNWSLRDPTRLGVAVQASPALFHRIEVREVTGKGRFTRGRPGASAAPITTHGSRGTP